MKDIFETIINMSLTSSVVIMVVMLTRLLIKPFPKKYSYALWSIVAFRLCCPFGIKSVFSIFNFNPVQSPSQVSKPNGTMNYINTPIETGIVGNGFKQSTNITSAGITHSGIATAGSILMWIWLAGAVILLVYGFASYIRLKKRLSTATKFDGNIYQSEGVSSPFILGIIKPKIYIPYGIESNYEYVIAHEKYHLKRCDHIVKFVSFLILCMHWFNPLCWIAFHLMSKDMEMSCDEKVLSTNISIKKQYSSALLSFATNKKAPTPSPLCFGEGAIKGRIKNILRYRKPKMIISVIAIILVGAVVTGCALNPEVAEEITNNAVDKVSNVVSPTAATIEKDTYMAGKCITSNPMLSSISVDGSMDYNKIIIKNKHLTVYDIEGKLIVDEDGELSDFTGKEEDKIYFTINDGMMFMRDEVSDYFINDDNITQLTVDGRDSIFYIFYRDEKPFAFCDGQRIYELIPYSENFQAELSRVIKDINYDQYPNNSNKYYYVEAHDTLQIKMGDINSEDKDKYITVFTYPYYAVLEKRNAMLCDIGGSFVPTALTFSYDDKGYTYKSYWQPGEGKYYQADLKSVFPEYTIYYDYENSSVYDSYVYKLRQEAYKSAIEKTDYNFGISEALGDLGKPDGLFGKKTYTFKDDYEGIYYEQYDALICYGEYTMRYIYSEFMKGGQTGTYGNVMAYMMKKIMGDELKNACNNGQEYFDAYLKHIVKIYNQNKDDEWYIETLKNDSPYDYLLLEMTDNL